MRSTLLCLPRADAQLPARDPFVGLDSGLSSAAGAPPRPPRQPHAFGACVASHSSANIACSPSNASADRLALSRRTAARHVWPSCDATAAHAEASVGRSPRTTRSSSTVPRTPGSRPWCR
eukprot:351938-Chlamydomonas_euryale.AAC.8